MIKTTGVLGVAEKMLGPERVMVRCQDGYRRLCRIRGKMKRRAWVRRGDIVLVSPWDFPFEEERRHHLALQEKPSWMAEGKWLFEDLIRYSNAYCEEYRSTVFLV